MADDPDAGEGIGESAYISGIEPDEVVGEEQLRPTPRQHEQLHGAEQFDEIKRAERRYLVVGRGGDAGPGKRRLEV